MYFVIVEWTPKWINVVEVLVREKTVRIFKIWDKSFEMISNTNDYVVINLVFNLDSDQNLQIDAFYNF